MMAPTKSADVAGCSLQNTGEMSVIYLRCLVGLQHGDGAPGRSVRARPAGALPKVEPHSVTRLWNILARYACLPSQLHFHCEMRRTLSMPDTTYLWFAYSAETNISYISELEWVCPQSGHRMKNQENEETKDSQRLLPVRNVPSIKPRTRGRLASGLVDQMLLRTKMTTLHLLVDQMCCWKHQVLYMFVSDFQTCRKLHNGRYEVT
jgi:hypothetical protein